MRILRREWERVVECGHCGAKQVILAEDVFWGMVETLDSITAWPKTFSVTSTALFYHCGVCRERNELKGVPEDVRRKARGEKGPITVTEF